MVLKAPFFENMGCGSAIQANLIAFALHHVSLRNQSYSYAQPPEQRFVDFVCAVHRYTFCRSRIYILASTDLHLSIVQRPVNERSTPSDWAFTGRWLSVQRPVNDGKVFIEKRNNLGFSLIMMKFRHSVRCLRIHPFARVKFYLCREKILRVLKKSFFVYRELKNISKLWHIMCPW